MLIIAAIFLAIGNYLPKLDYVKNTKTDKETAQKINRFAGFEMVIMGLLALITLFLPPVASTIWIFLIIPYLILLFIYTKKMTKEK